MDWPSAGVSFDDTDFGKFEYEQRPFKVIRKLLSDQEPVTRIINSPEDLEGWIRENKALIHQNCKYGSFAIVFSRSNDSFASPRYLPVSKGGFSKLIEMFRIHPMIVRTILREITYFSRMYLPTKGPNANSIVYTARMSSAWDDDVAMSSTYLTRRKINFSVFYGCNEMQSSKIEDLLGSAGDAISHPMLAPGILAELDRDRLVRRVKSILPSYLASTESLCCTSRDPESIMNRDGESTDELLYIYQNTSELMTGIRQAKRQIADMDRHISELDIEKKTYRKRIGPRKRTNTNFGRYFEPSGIETRFHERLLDIGAEYDDKLDECQMVLKGLNYTTQMASDHVARNQMFETRKENAQMRSIALVTMVYLPLTSIASIFSMGVFDWDATANQNVLTFYFWVYIAIASGFTILTVGLWWVSTRARRKKHNPATDLV